MIHAIKLARNSGFEAHVRDGDLSVVFAPAGGDGVRLFAAHGERVARAQPRSDLGDQRRTLTTYFVLTDGCNLRCEYCDVLGRGDGRPAGSTMAWSVARRGLELLSARLAAQPDLHAQVTLFGGEPTLAWPLLTQICDELAAHPDRDRIARMLVTNGTLLDRQRVAYLRAHRVYVVVSLDGGPEVNDGMRTRSYDAVAAGLDLLHVGMPGAFGISCTVGAHNAARLGRELEFLNERFRPLCIGLNIYHYQRDGTSPIAMDPDALGDSLLEAFRTAREKRIAIYQFIGILRAFARRRRNLDYCPACVDKLLFTPRGRVGRCETLMDDPRYTMPLEEVSGPELGPKLDWTRYTPEHEPACQTCATRWICPGSCAYDMLVTTGQPCGVDRRRCRFHTRLLVEMLDLLLEASGPPGDGGVVIPDQRAFDAVVGGMPTTFPADTIWIVSLKVTPEEGP